MAQGTLAVSGIGPLVKSLKVCDKDTRKAIKAILRATGDAVKADATALFDPYDDKSAHGYRTYVRQRGVAVEQRYRKTTGLRPNFGPLQMEKALEPALEDNAPRTRLAVEHALDEIARRFNR